MPDLTEVRAARQERDAARDALYVLALRREELERRGGDVRNELGRLRQEIAAAGERVREHDAALAATLAGHFRQRTPEELVADWDDRLPVLLLPLRVETKWRSGDPPELCVRVFPDDVAITTHEKLLSPAEVEHGQTYWRLVHAAPEADERDRAWRGLASHSGVNRAEWVALRTRPANWQTAAGDQSTELEFDDPGPTKPDAWTMAPHSRVMPDRLMLLGWRGGKQVLAMLGEPIGDVLVVGPSPLPDSGVDASVERGADGELVLGDDYAWVADFDRAVKAGVGFRVTAGDGASRAGFDRIVVLGLKHSADDQDAKALVEDLIDNHHYSRPGLGLVAQGSPTNNTGGNDTPYVRRGRDPEAGSPAGLAEPLFTPADDRSDASDAQRLADFLGIDYAPLQHAEGADLADHAEAVAMNRALYAGTLGYYLDHMLAEVVSERQLPTLRSHFTTQVTGRGPLPALRVGAQPYGILPTSVFGRWRADAREKRHGEFESRLHQVITRFESAWSTVQPTRLGAPGDAAAHLLDVLGLHPTSEDLHQRVGYSYDYLRNLESFSLGGSDFDDVIKMMFESMVGRALLGELGDTGQRDDGDLKPTPLLFQLIWRHHDVLLARKQLVDGRPLSETDRIVPLDQATGENYIDWLMRHAADSTRLEAEDFDGVPKPTTLLYMLLRFSVLMESARGIHRWLGLHDIAAPELVRSRKFHNIGPAASASPWEVFRAPANRILDTEPSVLPLLEFVNLPEQAEDAGAGLADQRRGLERLRSLPTARLERALVEHVDTLSYRLDAWQMSLFSRRLHRQRRLHEPVEERRTGLYLGAYGYLEDVRPRSEPREPIPRDQVPQRLQGQGAFLANDARGGYVHAPSLNHATAAALLRNGYLTHADATRPDALAVNLTSDRVRRARELLQGIRNGQSLEVLLGAQFERGLHDWTTRPVDPVVVEHLKPAFRAAFPIRRTRVPQAAGGGPETVEEDHTVVNGLALARTRSPFPYGVPGLGTPADEQRQAVEAEKDRIENALDALRDVLTAEAAYQLALGNFDRAAAVVRAIGDGEAPADVEVLRTPRGSGISFTNRLVIQLSPARTANPWPAVALTDRAKLDPALNHWLGEMLGEPATSQCVVTATAQPGGPELARDTVSLADLGLQPLDLVHTVRRETDQTGVAELEAHVRNRFCRAAGVPDDAIVTISFGDAGPDAGARPLAETLALADRLRRMIGSARPLDAGHFASASKDAPAAPSDPGRIDLTELKSRVGTALDEMPTRVAGLVPLVAALRATPSVAAADAVRDRLLSLARNGFPYAVPRSAHGADPSAVADLLDQADGVIRQGNELAASTPAQLALVDGPGKTIDEKIAILNALVREWMGADLELLPRFTYADVAAVEEAHASRDALLAHARAADVTLPVEEWLHGTSCVRPLVHDFEMVRTMAAGHLRMACAPLQLPYSPGDSWLGSVMPASAGLLHDTVSLVQHLPHGFDPTGLQCGLLIDEWVETIPKRDEVTGITFNFNAPNSAPPQALLLAVTPEETGSWSWQDLVDTILDTFRRARLRAVEPDAVGEMGGIGTLLPAVMAEFTTGRSTISLDYSIVLPAVQAHLANLAAASTRTGGGG